MFSALLHSSLKEAENAIIWEGTRTSPRVAGTAASLTIHSVWDRARYGSGRVGGSGLRGWGRGHPQWPACRCCSHQGEWAGVQLTADGDLERKGHDHPPLRAFSPRASLRTYFLGPPTIPSPPWHHSWDSRPPTVALKKAIRLHLLFSWWIPCRKPPLQGRQIPQKQKLPVRTQPHCCDEGITNKRSLLTERSWAWLSLTLMKESSPSAEIGVINWGNKWDHQVHALLSPFAIQFIFFFFWEHTNPRNTEKNMRLGTERKVGLEKESDDRYLTLYVI